MKVALSNLLLTINQKSKEINTLRCDVMNNCTITKDRELDGTEQILVDVKEFEEVLKVAEENLVVSMAKEAGIKNIFKSYIDTSNRLNAFNIALS